MRASALSPRGLRKQREEQSECECRRWGDAENDEHAEDSDDAREMVKQERWMQREGATAMWEAES